MKTFYIYITVVVLAFLSFTTVDNEKTIPEENCDTESIACIDWQKRMLTNTNQVIRYTKEEEKSYMEYLETLPKFPIKKTKNKMFIPVTLTAPSGLGNLNGAVYYGVSVTGLEQQNTNFPTEASDEWKIRSMSIRADNLIRGIQFVFNNVLTGEFITTDWAGSSDMGDLNTIHFTERCGLNRMSFVFSSVFGGAFQNIIYRHETSCYESDLSNEYSQSAIIGRTPLTSSSPVAYFGTSRFLDSSIVTLARPLINGSNCFYGALITATENTITGIRFGYAPCYGVTDVNTN